MSKRREKGDRETESVCGGRGGGETDRQLDTETERQTDWEGKKSGREKEIVGNEELNKKSSQR